MIEVNKEKSIIEEYRSELEEIEKVLGKLKRGVQEK